MIVYRICSTAYSEDISGMGAKLYGGRWNSKGIQILYTAECISLAVLEMLVNNHFKDFSIPLSLLKIHIPDTSKQSIIYSKKLKPNWIKDISYTNFIGNEFIKSNINLLAKVPSAVVPDENNFLINPLHPDFVKVKIKEITFFDTDKRLFTID